MGVDIEIGKAIAAELGVALEWVEAEFDSILMAISRGSGDIAITGMTIKESRKEEVDFSVPYVDSVQYLILPADSEIAAMEDLAGKTVGVAMGYTGQFIMEDEIAEGVLQGSGTNLTEYNDAMTAAVDMNNGRVDAVVMDELVAISIAAETGNKAIALKYANGSIATEQFGVVVPKGNPELLAAINTVVQRLVDAGQIDAWIDEFE
jgi:polar amino acid transport system substrate-binding protein